MAPGALAQAPALHQFGARQLGFGFEQRKRLLMLSHPPEQNRALAIQVNALRKNHLLNPVELPHRRVEPPDPFLKLGQICGRLERVRIRSGRSFERSSRFIEPTEPQQRVTQASQQLWIWTCECDRLLEMLRGFECFPAGGEQCPQFLMRIRIPRIGRQRRSGNILCVRQPAMPRQQFGEASIRPVLLWRRRNGGSKRLFCSLIVSQLDLGDRLNLERIYVARVFTQDLHSYCASCLKLASLDRLASLANLPHSIRRIHARSNSHISRTTRIRASTRA